jgi:hypothetical protein
MFTSARHGTVSKASRMQSTHSHTISLGTILMLPSRLPLGLPTVVLASSFPEQVSK